MGKKVNLAYHLYHFEESLEVAKWYQIHPTSLFTVVYQTRQKANIIRNRFVASSYDGYNWWRETIWKCQNIIEDIFGEISEVLSRKNKAVEQK